MLDVNELGVGFVFSCMLGDPFCRDGLVHFAVGQDGQQIN